MKIAYLITAYNNPSHLNSLIQALDDENNDLYIHIDKKSKFTFELPTKENIYLLKDNINVYWGGFSFIKAVLKLIKTAIKIKKYDYYILVSGTDYPIRSNRYIEEFLNKYNGYQFINISRMPENDKPFHRIEYFYLETDYDFKFVSLLKRILNRSIRIINIKRKLPNQYSQVILYGGSNWWAFSKDFVNYLISFIEMNTEFVNFFKNTLIPEESFFHTILGNSPFMSKVKNSFVFTEWADNHIGHPEEINEQHLELIKNNEIESIYGNKKSIVLFARKFSDNSSKLIKKIDTTLRTT